jgi:hypothetical protein
MVACWQIVCYSMRCHPVLFGLSPFMAPMKRCTVRAWLLIAGLLGTSGLSSSGGWCAETDGVAQMRAEFSNPPFRYHSRPLWFWNGKLDADKTRAMVAACKKAGYCGMGILPSKGMGFDFMGPEFLKQYKAAIDEAGKLGMKMCLYDEFWFPSGSAGGLLAKKHPEALGKRLDMLATDVTGPKQFMQALPAGVLMGAVAMETATKKRLDITASVKDGTLRWDVPPGAWKVMIFTCVPDGGAGLVDYLEPKSVEAFIALTYQTYHDAMPAHFGTTIDSAFYDEPAFYHVQGGRVWTPRFNERFRARFHTDPVALYPALWFDIGPDTAAARNALFGMRAELYATGFVKTIGDWCAAHHMGLTGHADQEEVANPVIGTVGDLMKAFKHQSMPGIDQVFAYGRASRAYKVVSSAACNYDRPQVMTECYGGMNLPLPNLYKEAMDQFAKGINTMVPHAVWYDSPRILVQPDLSPDAPQYGPELPAYNQYIGRLQRMLQGGRHVADIGVLYPIATLQAGSWFGPGKPYNGCVTIAEADYMDLGELLALNLRRDFTFVHPEVLDEKCSVAGAEIHLNNRVNAEQYKVFVIPGSRAIHWSNLKKIKEFYDQGGRVIATTRLPQSSAEFGKDAEVRAAIAAMFNQPAYPRLTASSTWNNSPGFDPGAAADGDPATRWNAADGDRGPQWIEVDFGEAKTFVKTVVREAFDRTRAYRIQAWDGAKWNDCAKGERLGIEQTNTFASFTAAKVRLCIDAIASDSASIFEFEVLDAGGKNLASIDRRAYSVRSNAQGGKAYFIPSPQADTLKTVLDDALAVYDVTFEQDVPTPNGNLSYIHKVVEGRQVYFFGNSSDAAVDTFVRLCGKLNLELWDPHTGRIEACETETISGNSGQITRVRLKLAPVQSVFLVETPARE